MCRDRRFKEPRTREEILEKFFRNVKKSPSGCWEWVGTFGSTGYGFFYMGPHWPGGYKGIGAHVASYALFIAHCPKGLYVCHHCDNKACVNPEHLFIGTAKENMRDARQKGRLPTPEQLSQTLKKRASRGEGHYKSNLRSEEVLKIVELSNQQVPAKEIAKTFHIKREQVYKILRGVRWQHLTKIGLDGSFG